MLRQLSNTHDRFVSDAIFELLTNYRGLAVIESIMGGGLGKEYDFYLTSLNNYFKSYDIITSEQDIKDMIDNFVNTIKYLSWCNTNIWSKAWLGEKVLLSTHNMPKAVLEYYRNSMIEMNRISLFNLEQDIKEYMENKHLLDFGCGGGSLLKILNDELFKVASYTGVDRKEIVSPYSSQGSEIKFIAGDGLEIDLDPYDVIWLGEVLHGRDNKEAFLDDLTNKLNMNQILIVSELNPFSSRAHFFDVKMLLHTGAKDSLEETMNCVRCHEGLKIIKNCRVSLYHNAIVAQIK